MSSAAATAARALLLAALLGAAAPVAAQPRGLVTGAEPGGRDGDLWLPTSEAVAFVWSDQVVAAHFPLAMSPAEGGEWLYVWLDLDADGGPLARRRGRLDLRGSGAALGISGAGAAPVLAADGSSGVGGVALAELALTPGPGELPAARIHVTSALAAGRVAVWVTLPAASLWLADEKRPQDPAVLPERISATLRARFAAVAGERDAPPPPQAIGAIGAPFEVELVARRNGWVLRESRVELLWDPEDPGVEIAASSEEGRVTASLHLTQNGERSYTYYSVQVPTEISDWSIFDVRASGSATVSSPGVRSHWRIDLFSEDAAFNTGFELEAPGVAIEPLFGPRVTGETDPLPTPDEFDARYPEWSSYRLAPQEYPATRQTGDREGVYRFYARPPRRPPSEDGALFALDLAEVAQVAEGYRRRSDLASRRIAGPVEAGAYSVQTVAGAPGREAAEPAAAAAEAAAPAAPPPVAGLPVPAEPRSSGRLQLLALLLLGILILATTIAIVFVLRRR